MACLSCFNVLSLSKESLLLLWLSQRDLFSLISPSRSVFVFKSFLSFFFSIPLLCSRASRVRVVGSSPLCPRNADRRVVCGWGLRMLFLSALFRTLSFSLFAALCRSFSHLKVIHEVPSLFSHIFLVILHLSGVCSSFSLLLQSFLPLNAVYYHYMEQHSVSCTALIFLMGLSWPKSQGQSRFITEEPAKLN